MRDGKAKRTPVRIIQRNTENVLVEAAIGEGDQVVTEGIHLVREGAALRSPTTAVPPQPASEQPSPVGAGSGYVRANDAEARHDAITTPRPGGKGITALFVRRPVLAFVLNTLIAVAGLAAFYGVEIRELPDVDRPVITINADFTGASGETIDREVTAVIEGAVARVSGVKSISSSSSYGRSRVTVEFNDDVDLDVAASDARDAVSRIQNQLPEDIDAPRIVKADANADAGDASRRHLRHHVGRGHDHPGRGRDRRHAGRRARRRRRAGLWRPREDLPRRHRPEQDRQPRPDHRRHPQRARRPSPSTRRPAR